MLWVLISSFYSPTWRKPVFIIALAFPTRGGASVALFGRLIALHSSEPNWPSVTILVMSFRCVDSEPTNRHVRQPNRDLDVLVLCRRFDCFSGSLLDDRFMFVEINDAALLPVACYGSPIDMKDSVEDYIDRWVGDVEISCILDRLISPTTTSMIEGKED